MSGWDAILKRMLSMPPKPHKPKAEKPAAKPARKKGGREAAQVPGGLPAHRLASLPWPARIGLDGLRLNSPASESDVQ